MMKCNNTLGHKPQLAELRGLCCSGAVTLAWRLRFFIVIIQYGSSNLTIITLLKPSAHSRMFIVVTCDFCLWSKKSAVCGNLKPSAHSRFLSLRQAIFVLSLKSLLCAVTED